MKIFGIIAEFNPFHNGHKYIIEKIKKTHNPDLIVVVISGSFVQRGELNYLSKWDRAFIACLNGCNLILEMPVLFSCQNAEIFAKGGIKILNEIGITDLVFGAENSSISDLKKIAIASMDETPQFKEVIRKYLNEGYSFINSRNLAYKESGILKEKELEILSRPNNILGIEYIKAGIEKNPNINFHSIGRYKVEHGESEAKDSISSASHIRKLHRNGKNIDELVPKETSKILSQTIPYCENTLFKIFKYDILNDTASIKNTLEYEKGIENRLLNKLEEAITIEELANIVSSKRMTKSRIRRIIFNSLIRISGEDVFNGLNGETYLRILGADSKGRSYLNEFDKYYITNFKEIKKASFSIKQVAEFENKATNLYSIIANLPLNLDYITNPIML